MTTPNLATALTARIQYLQKTFDALGLVAKFRYLWPQIEDMNPSEKPGDASALLRIIFQQSQNYSTEELMPLSHGMTLLNTMIVMRQILDAITTPKLKYKIDGKEIPKTCLLPHATQSRAVASAIRALRDGLSDSEAIAKMCVEIGSEIREHGEDFLQRAKSQIKYTDAPDITFSDATFQGTEEEKGEWVEWITSASLAASGEDMARTPDNVVMTDAGFACGVDLVVTLFETGWTQTKILENLQSKLNVDSFNAEKIVRAAIHFMEKQDAEKQSKATLPHPQNTTTLRDTAFFNAVRLSVIKLVDVVPPDKICIFLIDKYKIKRNYANNIIYAARQVKLGNASLPPDPPKAKPAESRPSKEFLRHFGGIFGHPGFNG